MRGTITATDVLRHPILIASEFGPACFLRCLAALLTGRRTTFLAIVFGR